MTEPTRQIRLHSIMATESGLVELRITSHATKEDFLQAWGLYETRFFAQIKEGFTHAYDSTPNPNVRAWVVEGDVLAESPPLPPDEAQRRAWYEQHRAQLVLERDRIVAKLSAKFGITKEAVDEIMHHGW